MPKLFCEPTLSVSASVSRTKNLFGNSILNRQDAKTILKKLNHRDTEFAEKIQQENEVKISSKTCDTNFQTGS
jgi:hypothetical protein